MPFFEEILEIMEKKHFMKRALHTPGPWSFDGLNRLGSYRIKNEKRSLADVYGWEIDAKKEGEANARLIAAAPDLLEALEDIQMELQVHLANNLPNLHRTVCAVIAKAKGGI